MTGPFAQQLGQRAQAAGLTLDSSLSSSVEAYFELLRYWNRRINLTGLDLDALTTDGIDRLFIEPLVAARHVTPQTSSIIDLGSGGGSPALPLALAVRTASLTMIESRGKKAVFLREAARELGLIAIVLSVRFEEALERQGLIGAFDTLSCRALRLSSRDLGRAGQFVRNGGRLLLFRSQSDPSQPAPEPPLSRLIAQPLPRAQSELIVLQKTG